MTGKHFNWHKNWKVDLSACTATHESGLIVKFKKATDQSGAWDGEPVNANSWFDEIKTKMPPDDLSKHVSRLLREAGDTYLWHLKKRH